MKLELRAGRVLAIASHQFGHDARQQIVEDSFAAARRLIPLAHELYEEQPQPAAVRRVEAQEAVVLHALGGRPSKERRDHVVKVEPGEKGIVEVALVDLDVDDDGNEERMSRMAVAVRPFAYLMCLLRAEVSTGKLTVNPALGLRQDEESVFTSSRVTGGTSFAPWH